MKKHVRQGRRYTIVSIILFVIVGLFIWRTISMATYQKGFNINIYNQTKNTIPYIAFGGLDPVHEFYDIDGEEIIRTHVNSMNGERVIVFLKGNDLVEETIMYVMSEKDETPKNFV